MRHPSASKTRRVVQWSSGACGKLAIGAIQRRPDLELIGLWVHDSAKVGRDVGELAGGEPIGLRATDDADALLALAPDCVCYTAIGVVHGRDAIVIEHVNRMARDLAPDWPNAESDGVYRIEIEGDPRLRCELEVGTEKNFSDQGLVVTTMRAVNAIPYVCDAAPGVISAVDLPLTVPYAAFA